MSHLVAWAFDWFGEEWKVCQARRGLLRCKKGKTFNILMGVIWLKNWASRCLQCVMALALSSLQPTRLLGGLFLLARASQAFLTVKRLKLLTMILWIFFLSVWKTRSRNLVGSMRRPTKTGVSKSFGIREFWLVGHHCALPKPLFTEHIYRSKPCFCWASRRKVEGNLGSLIWHTIKRRTAYVKDANRRDLSWFASHNLRYNGASLVMDSSAGLHAPDSRNN